MSTPADKLREAAQRSADINAHVQAKAEEVKQQREKEIGNQDEEKQPHGD